MPHRMTCDRLQEMKVSAMRLHLDSLDSNERLRDWISQSFSDLSQKSLGRMMLVPKRSGYRLSVLVLKPGCLCTEVGEENSTVCSPLPSDPVLVEVIP